MRRLMDLFLAMLLLGGFALLAQLVLREAEMTGPAYAIDGDTLDLAGEHVRLLGIDAPEREQTCMRDGKTWGCGQAARQALADALRDGPVTCTYGERDAYDRPLARCEVKGQDLGARLVAEGLAVSYRSRAYAGQEAAARAAKRGIWAGTFQRPVEYRAAHRR